MALTGNGFQLLLDLNVDNDNSRNNINNYIKNLKGLERVRVELDVQGSSGGITNAQNQIKELQQQIVALKSELRNLGVNVDTRGIENFQNNARQTLATLRQAQSEVGRLASSSGTGNNGAIQQQVTQAGRLRDTISAVRQEVVRVNREFQNNGSRWVGTVDALRTAFHKFPIWLISGSVFFTTIAGVTDLTRKVIELDTALTNLRRVSDANPFEFDTVIDRSIERVDALSGRLDEYLELLNEYSRTGKTLDQAFDLADTTQTLVNISDLDAKGAFDALTASTLAFNITAEDSIRIADKLNEVDNNFSITTRDLALSLNKASSTAQTFGKILCRLEK